MTTKCPHDPRETAGQPIGMYHCPLCGEMVVAGCEHPDHSILDDDKALEAYYMKKLEIDKKRYMDACHAMQSGVALKMNRDPKDTNPKHLRVGLNSAMVSNGALVELLISKGLITEGEMFEALADKMEEEVRLYESELPGNVKLG